MSKNKNSEDEISMLQSELKNLLKEVGWNLKDLAFKITLSEEYRSKDREDCDKEYEILRKVLNRKSTKPETLHHYINFIIEENQGRKLYKQPEPDISSFSEVEQDILKEIGKIAFQVFESEQQKA